jgi:hypothetical protein
MTYKKLKILGTEVHAWEPSTWEVEAGGPEFESLLDYTVRSCPRAEHIQRIHLHEFGDKCVLMKL